MKFRLFSILLLFSNTLLATTQYDVLGIGTAMTDLLIEVDDAFLQEYTDTRGGSNVVSIQEIDQILAISLSSYSKAGRKLRQHH